MVLLLNFRRKIKARDGIERQDAKTQKIRATLRWICLTKFTKSGMRAR